MPALLAVSVVLPSLTNIINLVSALVAPAFRGAMPLALPRCPGVPALELGLHGVASGTRVDGAGSVDASLTVPFLSWLPLCGVVGDKSLSSVDY